MSSIQWGEVVEAFDGLDAAVAACAEVDVDGLSTSERFELLERVEVVRRRLPALEHDLVNELIRQGSPTELGGKPGHVLADRLLISRAEAGRRIAAAAELGPRITLTGAPLEPVWAATAAAQAGGRIGEQSVGVIRSFLHQLPGFIDVATTEKVEADLVAKAEQFRPEQVKIYAEHLELLLNPDGTYTDEDRAHRRGITIGGQDVDGMSPIKGWVDPELRAGLDAVFSKLAAPGACNPADQTALVEGEPSEERIKQDTRSPAQRNHDALGAMVRSVLSSGELGSAHGLPVTIIATATVQDLQAKAGMARTGGGTLLPISDLIRMARHSYHYLALFDDAKPCALYRGRDTRLATKEQRLVLHAFDRGCTRPGCDVPGYLCEVNHVDEWAKGGLTNIDKLTFACKPDHRLLQCGWTTRKLANGFTQWIPPPGSPTPGGTNDFHHPERLLKPDSDDAA